ncbi:MAG TPA: hypothetical protein PLD36_06235, partial [Bacteroidia bacterium]|nr:hypothetical protein [Bacteroidia bacterium]
MELSQILKIFRERPQTRQLVSTLLQRNPKRISLDGLTGSSDALFLAALYLEMPHPALFILGDR